MTSNFPSRYQLVPMYYCIMKGPPHFPRRVIKAAPVVTSNFPSGYQLVPFSPSRYQRGPDFQNTPSV